MTTGAWGRGNCRSTSHWSKRRGGNFRAIRSGSGWSAISFRVRRSTSARWPRRRRWDYLIGSVHYVTPEWDIDNPKHLKRWSEQPVEDIWTAYFAAYTKMIESCLFDFLAHPDLVKKFGLRPEGDLSRFYHEMLDAAAEAGSVLEVSTAGLRKDAKEIYPSRQFLEQASLRQIPIVINSDAHAPEEVAYEFDQAYALAREVGYSEVMRFEKRRAVPVEIA